MMYVADVFETNQIGATTKNILSFSLARFPSAG